MAAVFNTLGMSIMEIHSRKSQPNRIRTSEEFRQAKSAVMFSSDVTARGMDYPDVTLVVQMGMTTRDQYIHRLGRTARAGKKGSGVLVCSPDEFRLDYPQIVIFEPKSVTILPEILSPDS